MSGTCYDVLYCSDTDDEEKHVKWATPLENFYKLPAREQTVSDEFHWCEEYDSDEFEAEWEFTPLRNSLANERH